MQFRAFYPVLLLSLFAVVACSPEDKSPGQQAPDREVSGQDSAAAPWYVVGAEAEKGDEVVYKSPNDSRQYRFIVLKNGLSVLLVSDPDTDKAAASLSVNIGSFDNPPDRQGLAHFLEHMLFLGTDKYPEPGEYQAFISEHGGMHNAYTSLEETNYFFDVDAPHLMATLDRFSRFFVAPLFNPEYVERERHAVESEYRLKLKDDSRREWDVLRELANPEHPFAQFSVGNLTTLEDRVGRPVREDLLDFYREKYSANQMNLVVLGTENLDQLQAAVEQRFAEVPNRKLVLPEKTIPLFAKPLPFKVSITPEKELRQLSVSFPMPTVAATWSAKPVDYLAHLLGHEGEGTLLAELKRLGLAENLGAGLVYDSRVGSLFSVTVSLTEVGVTKSDAITRALFEWISLVKTHGLEDWRYGELADLSQIAFRFADKHSPINYVRQISTQLHTYPPAEALRGPYLYQGYDGTMIGEFASHLRPDNALVTLVAQGAVGDEPPLLSTFYQAPYRVESLVADDLSTSGNGSEAAIKGLALHLPEANVYIPEHLEVNQPPSPQDKPVAVTLDDSSGLSLWHYPDSVFNTPRALFEARIAIADLQDLRRETLLDLYRSLVQDQLSSQTYPAQQAGLGFDIGRWENGLSLRVSGYSEKQPLLLADITRVMAQPDWDQARFDRVRNTLLRLWRNTAKDWPISQVFAAVSPLLRDSWLPLEKADALEALTLEDLKLFAADLYGSSHARFYAGGNLDRTTAGNMAVSVNQQLGLQSSDDDAIAINYLVKNLAATEPLPLFNVFVNHDDNVSVLFLQGAEDSLRERALFALIQKATEAPFYSELRTEKQLGYVVGSSISPMHRVPGLLFYVQSPTVEVAGIRTEMDGFFTAWDERIAALGEEDLQRLKEAVLGSLEEKPKNIMELAGRHLESLYLGYDDFDFRNQLAAAVRATSLEALREGYRRVVLEQRQGLWLQSSRDVADKTLDRKKRDSITEGVFSYPQ